MLRKALALAMLCLTLLLCGVDTSAVGAPAESATALHALVQGHQSGVRGDLGDLAGAALVALSLVLVLTPPTRSRLTSWIVVADDVPPPVGWFTSHAERGPPSLA